MLNARAHTSPARTAEIFAALGDCTRLSLLAKLNDGDTRSITALSEHSKLTRQAVTKHLRVLEDVGLVRSTRIGRETQFVFQPDRVKEAQAYLNMVSRQWDEALGRLKSFVEKK